MSEKKAERRGLGRGLSALMADINVSPTRDADEVAGKRSALRLPVEQLVPNPNQPRRDFEPAALEELAASVREKGIIQPLLVRPHPHKPGVFEIVAGERRWRAAQMAQLHEVPVLVRELSDTEVLEIAIIENIQRTDLNPVEEAMGYRQLMEHFGHTQEKMAEALSKSRSYIANLLRLLHLPDEVQLWLREGKISAGHARALIPTKDPVALARQVINKGLSVRETERIAKADQGRSGEARRSTRRVEQKDADTRALELDLSSHLRMKVSIDHKGLDGGTLVITYRSLEQLDELCQILSTMR
jgi:ParB family chromosome partitioning protein